MLQAIDFAVETVDVGSFIEPGFDKVGRLPLLAKYVVLDAHLQLISYLLLEALPVGKEILEHVSDAQLGTTLDLPSLLHLDWLYLASQLMHLLDEAISIVLKTTKCSLLGKLANAHLVLVRDAAGLVR